MSKLRVGILGCAQIAERYAIDALKSLPDVRLIAIASRDPATARAWASRHNLEAESYESLLARKDVDVIYSPLPVGLQEAWVLRAAEEGKHVICEKSITDSFESAERMVDVCRGRSVALYENFVPGLHPQHRMIRERIAAGDIGIPRTWSGRYGFPPFADGDIRYRKDLSGGALNDCGCYTLFMARLVLAAEPIAVTCVLRNEGAEVDISGSALLEFPDATATMSFGFNHLYQNEYSIWGSRGMIETHRAFAIPPTLVPEVILKTNDGTQESLSRLDVPAADQFALSFAYVCAAIRTGDSAAFEDMYDRILSQARAMEALRISARDGVRVVLGDL